MIQKNTITHTAKTKQNPLIFDRNQIKSEIDKIGLGKYIFELAFIVLAFVLSKSVETTVVIIITIIIINFVLILIKVQTTVKNKYSIGILGSVTIIGCLSTYLFFGTNLLSPKYEQAQNICKQPSSLYDYFRCGDFPQLIAYSFHDNYPMFDSNNVRVDTVHIECRITMDDKQDSYFVCFFIHETEGDYAFCKGIPEVLFDILRNPEHQRRAIQEPLIKKYRTLNDLKFTNKVYVYHESMFDGVQVHYLSDMFKEKYNLNVEFRGPFYPKLKRLS